MDAMDILALGKNSIMLALMLASPLLIVGMAVGIFVALFQAVTQIQEMTLTFVPKIFAVMMALMFFSSWMLIKITDFTRDLLIRLPEFIR